jgi:hypothetical protein
MAFMAAVISAAFVWKIVPWIKGKLLEDMRSYGESKIIY